MRYIPHICKPGYCGRCWHNKRVLERNPEAVPAPTCTNLATQREPIERDRRRCALGLAPDGLVTCCNVVKPGEWTLGGKCGPGCKGFATQSQQESIPAELNFTSSYVPVPIDPGTPWPVPGYGYGYGYGEPKKAVNSLPTYRSLPAEAASHAIRPPAAKRAAWWAVAGDDERYYRFLRYSVESFLRHHTGWDINIAAPANRLSHLATAIPQATLHALRAEDILHVPQAVVDWNRRANGATYAIHIPTAATRLRMIADTPPDTTLLYSDCDVVYRRSIEPLAMQFEASGCAFAIMAELQRVWNVTNEMHWRGDAWRHHYNRPHQWGQWPCLNTGLMLARGGRSSIIAGQCHDLMKSPLYDDMRYGEQSTLSCAIWDDEQPFFCIHPNEHVIDKMVPHYDCIAQHYCGVAAKESLDREIRFTL